MNLQRFKTLLLREWMQHRLGWLLVMFVPPLLVMLLLPFGQVAPGDDLRPDFPTHGANFLAFGTLCATAVAMFGITWAINTFQLPGLARRDQQDRSIEFWMSLPSTHAESIGATLLMHALLVPMAALAAGSAVGLLMAAGLLTKLLNIGAIVQVDWALVLGMAAVALARFLIGIVLMSLWLAPLLLALMAASAWLKRLGVPVLVAATLIGGNLLKHFYETSIVFDLLTAQLNGASFALLRLDSASGAPEPEHLMDHGVAGFAQFMLENLGQALSQLASAQFIGGLLVAAACFWLLMLRRGRNA